MRLLEHILDQVHSSVTNRWYLQLFTAFVRCILALGFIPPSLPKITHRPFTVLPPSDPVGAYFHALYNTGFYYEFIGWSQIIAASLLLIPRTAHIGALIFLPIIVNIAVLTCSVGFRGTWMITIFMSLAAVWLAAWEYDRLKPIIFGYRSIRPTRFLLPLFILPSGFAASGGLIAAVWMLVGWGNFTAYTYIGFLLAAGGFIFGVVVAVHYRFMPAGRLREPVNPQ